MNTRSSNTHILCLGNVVVDVLAYPVDALPPKGGMTLVKDIRMALGGCASNTAVALAKMGTSVSLCAKVGQDPMGNFAVEELRRAGVDVAPVLRCPKTPTGATVVLVDSKAQRSFLHSVASNAELSPREVTPRLLKGFDFLHVGGYFLFPGLDGAPMGRLLKSAQQRGLVTVLDTAWDIHGRWMKALAPCLPHLDYFLPSEREVRHLVGRLSPRRAAEVFLRRGAGCVVIKMGEKGAYLRHKEGWELHQPARKTKAVDTTGAGDCFCAGFLKGLTLGFALPDCLKIACASGSLTVQVLGATSGIRSWEQVHQAASIAGPRKAG
jgi:sugar/nucleoside kinase (ribokinase family)